MRVAKDALCWCGGNVSTVWESRSLTPVQRCLESDLHDPTSTGRPKKVATLYVSGPMSGYPENNYPLFKAAAAQLRSRGFTAVDPSECHPEGVFHYTDLLREDIRNLLACDGVATLDLWWESAGSRCEVNVAGVVRMPVRPVSEWLTLGV